MKKKNFILCISNLDNFHIQIFQLSLSHSIQTDDSALPTSSKPENIFHFHYICVIRFMYLVLQKHERVLSGKIFGLNKPKQNTIVYCLKLLNTYMIIEQSQEKIVNSITMFLDPNRPFIQSFSIHLRVFILIKASTEFHLPRYEISQFSSR